jgi:hypothetical protein
MGNQVNPTVLIARRMENGSRLHSSAEPVTNVSVLTDHPLATRSTIYKFSQLTAFRICIIQDEEHYPGTCVNSIVDSKPSKFIVICIVI